MRPTILVAAVFFTSSFLSASEPHWPEFRGPRGDGHAVASGLPLHWSESENIAWKTAIHGRAWSSPVIWDRQIWLSTATEDGTRLYGVCLDLDTGEILQDRTVFEIAQPQFCHAFNSYASSTPAIEEGRVYLHFGSHGTACLDTASGETLWSRTDLPCDHYRGAGSSPVLYENLLIVHFDGFDLQYIVALDKATGQTVWRQDRNIDYGTTNGDLMKAYGTPLVIEVDGRPQLISPSAGATTAYEPRTGETLWRVQHGGMNAAARPLYGHGLLFINTGDGGFRLFAMRPDGRGDVTESHVAWKFDQNVPSRCSQLLVGELLFMINEAGIMTCLEAKTGEPVWRHRLGGNYSTAPLYADGRIYLFSQEGRCPVIAAKRRFELLADNQLDAGFMSSPAVAGRALILRTETHLYRVAD